MKTSKKFEKKEIFTGFGVCLEKGRRYYVSVPKQTVRAKKTARVEIRDHKTDEIVKTVSIAADSIRGICSFFPNGKIW